jgi:hypothetical protein
MSWVYGISIFGDFFYPLLAAGANPDQPSSGQIDLPTRPGYDRALNPGAGLGKR